MRFWFCIYQKKDSQMEAESILHRCIGWDSWSRTTVELTEREHCAVDWEADWLRASRGRQMEITEQGWRLTCAKAKMRKNIHRIRILAVSHRQLMCRRVCSAWAHQWTGWRCAGWLVAEGRWLMERGRTHREWENKRGSNMTCEVAGVQKPLGMTQPAYDNVKPLVCTYSAKTLHFLITPTDQYVIQVTAKSDGMSMF